MPLTLCFAACFRFKSPEVILHYLSTHVFPDVMQHQETKLMASGADLGGEMLFSTRLGFSGTPSDLLPYELQVRRVCGRAGRLYGDAPDRG